MISFLDSVLNRLRWLRDLYRAAAGRLAADEIRLGAVLAREELLAAAEQHAAEFDRSGNPALARALRAEVERLRSDETMSGPPAIGTGTDGLRAETAPSLPCTTTDGVNGHPPRRSAKKALPPTPPAVDPFAPPPPPSF